RADAHRGGGPVPLRAGRGDAARHVSARGPTGRQEAQGTDRIGRVVLLADAVLSVLPDVSAFRLQSVSDRYGALLRRRERTRHDRQHARRGAARHWARDGSRARDGRVWRTVRVSVRGACDWECQSFGPRGTALLVYRKQLSGRAYILQLGGSESAGARVVRQGQFHVQETYLCGSPRALRGGATAPEA